MISYRRSDLFHRMRQTQSKGMRDIINDVMGYFIRFIRPHDPTDDPDWDYKRCRCRNNEEYCSYCQSIEEIQGNRPRTSSKDSLIHILEHADRQIGFWKNLNAEMSPIDIETLEEGLDDPATRRIIEELIHEHPANLEVDASLLSYRRADIFDRVKEKNTPCTVTYTFRRDYASGGTRVEGGNYEEAKNSDWPQTVFNMIKAIEDCIEKWPEHIQRQYDAIIKNTFPEECAKRCIQTITYQPEYISHEISTPGFDGDAVLIVKVKKSL